MKRGYFTSREYIAKKASINKRVAERAKRVEQLKGIAAETVCYTNIKE